jgi:ABC-2 type transport system permease protein
MWRLAFSYRQSYLGLMAWQPMSMDAPTIRPIGRVNWRGLWTLYEKEVRRFLNVFTQTLVAPVVTSLLFLAIFHLAIGGRGREIAGFGFTSFLVPGLIMMSIVQNAFANTSSSLVIAKTQGNIVDLLMPPLSPGELTLGLVGGGVTRGLMVGTLVAGAMWFFVPYSVHQPALVAYHAVMAAVMLSLLGTIGGIWAEKFDQIAAVTNFIVMPFSFLSGTFYSIERLPPLWQTAAHFNPFFYMIDGFRFGLIGHADAAPALGVVVLAAVNALLALLVYVMFRTGYRLKS